MYPSINDDTYGANGAYDARGVGDASGDGVLSRKIFLDGLCIGEDSLNIPLHNKDPYKILNIG
jgi:hypothetical protein